jgi:hypothetical protein
VDSVRRSEPAAEVIEARVESARLPMEVLIGMDSTHDRRKG